jgi:sugar phosphate isomerase/epimerase
MKNKSTRRQFLRNTAAASLATTLAGCGSKVRADSATSKNLTRLKLGCCAYSYRDYLTKGKMKLEDFMHIAANLGLHGVELTTYYYESTEDEYLYNLKSLAYQLGLDIPSIAIRSNFCTQDESKRAEEVANTNKWVDVAVKLGASAIRIFGGTIPKGTPVEQAIEWTVAGIRAAVEYAGSKGVFLALENHGGVTEKAENVLKIHQQVNHDWFGLLLDTGNFHVDPYREIALAAPYAITTHIKIEVSDADGQKQPVNLDKICSILHKLQFKGYLNIEYEGAEDQMTGVPKFVEAMKKIVTKYSIV